ncbi:MAG: FtsH protease activity modulator HflK [Lysobacteraceae bacterium]|nr:MAG: FtsH protease activity modulator HflK [Xanthomonadaceae bacterium]
MAWNTPGGDNSNDKDSPSGRDRSPWKPRGGGHGPGGFDSILARLRELFDNGGPWRWLPALLAIWLAFNCFVLVAEQERAVVLRFGKFARVMEPGPGFKLPWPIESVEKVNATQIKNLNESVSVLTRDENIVQVQINVQYRIIDAKLYLFGTRDSDEVLRQAVLSSVREQVGRSTLDNVLNSREAIATAAKAQLLKSLTTYATGQTVTDLKLPDARPPDEVKPAFDDVNSAQQDKDRLISEARAYAAKVVPEARGEAARTRTVSEGYKTASIARATGDATRFTLLLQQYRGAPEVTRKRLWLETVQGVLADNRKIVGGDSRQLLYMPTPQARERAASAAPAPELIAPMVTATPEEGDTARTPRSKGREGSSR